jgi:Fic family protein
MNVNQISKQTAASDLNELESLGFIHPVKIGRKVEYFATEKIEKLFD